MTRTRVSDEVLGKISRQQNDLFRRVRDGSLDAGSVSRALQLIIEGQMTTVGNEVHIAPRPAPSFAWTMDPELQIERVKQLNQERGWGFADSDFPSVPAGFVPSTETEGLLLNVSLPATPEMSGVFRTFAELICLAAPSTLTSHSYDGNLTLTSESGTSGLEPVVTSVRKFRAGLEWVAFDPNAFIGYRPTEARDEAMKAGVQLAGNEVLMAALLSPDWITTGETRSVRLSGLLFESDSDDQHPAYLEDEPQFCVLNRVHSGGERHLIASLETRFARDRANPTVREC